MSELPADLALGGFWPVGGDQAGRLGGVCGGAQCVRAHVADGDGLTRGSGSGSCCGSLHLAGRNTTESFGLEQPQHPFCAAGGPCGNQTSVGFTQRLRRSHQRPLYVAS
ncbi:MAG: hypothetical protein ACRDVP_06305 [Acidimicrobiales bacterium]